MSFRSLFYALPVISVKNLVLFIFNFSMSAKSNFRSDFCYEFKLGRNAAKTTRNINEVWSEGASANGQFNADIKNFVPGLPASEMNPMAGAYRQLTMTN